MAKTPASKSENPPITDAVASGNKPQPVPPIITLSPQFKLIFLSVLSLTLLSLIASVVLVLFAKDSDEVKRLVETCSTTWKLGFGAMIGLIGGKTI